MIIILKEWKYMYEFGPVHYFNASGWNFYEWIFIVAAIFNFYQVWKFWHLAGGP